LFFSTPQPVPSLHSLYSFPPTNDATASSSAGLQREITIESSHIPSASDHPAASHARPQEVPARDDGQSDFATLPAAGRASPARAGTVSPLALPGARSPSKRRRVLEAREAGRRESEAAQAAHGGGGERSEEDGGSGSGGEGGRGSEDDDGAEER
jgi:hypothetical protein